MITVTTAEKVLSKLDGWTLIDSDDSGSTDPYPESNKRVTLEEVDDVWRSANSKARLHIRNNPTVFHTKLINDFVEAVIFWTASDLWRKYNNKVESPGQEGTAIDNRGKELYWGGRNILDNLRTNPLHGLS